MSDGRLPCPEGLGPGCVGLFAPPGLPAFGDFATGFCPELGRGVRPAGCDLLRAEPPPDGRGAEGRDLGIPTLLRSPCNGDLLPRLILRVTHQIITGIGKSSVQERPWGPSENLTGPTG